MLKPVPRDRDVGDTRNRGEQNEKQVRDYAFAVLNSQYGRDYFPGIHNRDLAYEGFLKALRDDRFSDRQRNEYLPHVHSRYERSCKRHDEECVALPACLEPDDDDE